MNGRSFDPELDRFMQVDPFMQAPLNSQSLNPYSYVMNNPLAGTDPTGYSVEGVSGVCPPGHADHCAKKQASFRNFLERKGIAWALGQDNGAQTGSKSTIEQAIDILSLSKRLEKAENRVLRKLNASVTVREDTRAGTPPAGDNDSGNQDLSPDDGQLFADNDYKPTFKNSATDKQQRAGIPITAEQQELLNKGTKEAVIEFYKMRIADGDGYAKLALAVVTGQSDSELMQSYGRMANAQLALEVMAAVMDGKMTLPAGGYESFMAQVNVDLARAHAFSVTQDFKGDRSGVPGLLNANQIQDYHEKYFQSIGLPAATFGGQTAGFNNNAFMRWCSGCDTN